jgi:hypothetical protein
MKKVYIPFIPGNDAEAGRWAENYEQKISTLGPLLGLTPAEITDQKDAAVVIKETATRVTLKKKEQKEAIDLMKNVRKNEVQVITKKVMSLKLSPLFKSNIGEELGIMGTSTSPLKSTIQPTIKLISYGGNGVEISFKKRGQKGVHLYSKIKGSLHWEHVAITTTSPYMDEQPLKVANTAETREYMARCWDDEDFGQESAVLHITVGV